jgi:prepilin peptidase CpaA
MIAELLVLVALPATIALAGCWDLASFTIPNFLQLILLSLFVVFIVAVHMPIATAGMHVLAAMVALCIGFALFAPGYIGGGDAKLFACVALWLGFQDIAAYALLAALFGGALTLGLLAVRKYPLPAFAHAPWVLRLHDSKSGIPYGAALAAGFFAILPQTQIFRLAAGL